VCEFNVLCYLLDIAANFELITVHLHRHCSWDLFSEFFWNLLH